jgi:hypothetical protein
VQHHLRVARRLREHAVVGQRLVHLLVDRLALSRQQRLDRVRDVAVGVAVAVHALVGRPRRDRSAGHRRDRPAVDQPVDRHLDDGIGG